MPPNAVIPSPRQAWGLASLSKDQPLAPWAFKRRALRPDDVAVRITYCGVCHTDLHAIQGGRAFPVVPGHEMVGEVTEAGAQVTRFAVGDSVAIGNIVDSCRHCAPCLDHDEPYCREFPTPTAARIAMTSSRPTAAIPTNTWPAPISSTTCRRDWTRRPWRRCFAQALPPGRRCGTGRSARA
jgi:D-arabinose 1-dehydrogenase-like Zn-dependent alcohol dehydrogenase